MLNGELWRARAETANTVSIRRAVRSIARRVLLPALLCPGICAAVDSEYTGGVGDSLLWPNLGYFPAYPLEPPKHPFSVYGSVNLGADDNLFRLSDSLPSSALGAGGRGDRYALLGAGVHGAMDFSRQHFVLNASADHYSFDRFSLLNEWVYSGDANLQWTVGSRLDGQLGYSRSRHLPNFGDLQLVVTDLVDEQHAHFNLDFHALQHVALHAVIEGSEYEHSVPQLKYLDNRVKAATGGISYVGAEGGQVGVQYKRSQGDYPNPQTVGTLRVDNDYTESESSVVITKELEGRSNVYIRAGYTQRRHEQLPQRDYDGPTGRAQFRYAISAKVLLQAAVYQELEAIEDLSASYALVRGASIGPAWAPTSKLVFQASYVYDERDFLGNPGIVVTPGPSREDHNRIAQLAAGYRPNDLISVALSFEHGTRTANIPLADYEYNRGNLLLKVSF